MTDMVLDAHRSLAPGWVAQPMQADGSGPRRAAQRREYRAYFTLLLTLELPIALVAWAMRALRDRAWPAQGPLRSARSRAALVTSLILSV